jgi:antitoxin (DNA-binding transcriptional repressor) of toxin-antitoxin stability system
MKEISAQQLHQDTGQWVRQAERERIVITDGGHPVASLTAIEESHLHARLPDREDKIKERSLINVDSADYISEMRGAACSIALSIST